MCGIAGYLRLVGSPIAPSLAERGVAAMTEQIAHRGPDGSGLWVDAQVRCFLGHRRLTVIDTSPGGAQPRLSHDARWALTFNGEIYNYRELGILLAAEGVRLTSRSDSEVLLEAIAHWGLPTTLERVDGMFAFAAYDRRDGVLHLARDPFGEKPLSYTRLKNGDIAFASEVDALALLEGFDRSVDLDAVAEVLSFQYIDAPRTIYQSAEKLPPGSWATIEASGALSVHRYYRFAPGEGGFEARPLADLADELEALLAASLERRLIADVPLGAFLSGGVDSSTVCALVRRKLGRPLSTFSIGFEGSGESEHVTARRFADHLGCQHHEKMLAPDTGDFIDQLGGLIDEPNGDSSCLPTYKLAAFARSSVTVALSGDGGDEMFGGYGRYLATLDEARSRSHGNPADVVRLGDVYYSPSRILIGDTGLVKRLMGGVPVGFSARLDQLRHHFDQAPTSLLQRMRADDAAHYMPGAVLAKVDRMSMQHALEVRTPFLDRAVAAFAERLPDEVLVSGPAAKRILREIAYRYLPRDLVDLPKRGFGLPADDWARSDLLATTRRLVMRDDSKLAHMFGRGRLERFVEAQGRPGGFAPYQVWSIAVLESWLGHHAVDLPEAAPERDRPRQGASGLVARPLVAGVYVVDPVSEDPSGDETETSDGSAIDQAPPELMPRLAELIADAPRSGSCLTKPRAPIFLPGWGAPPWTLSLADKAELEGSTLVFRDYEASLALDLPEIDRLSDMGVRAVLFRNAHSVGEAVELTFKPRREVSPLNLLRLFVRNVGRMAVGRLALLAPGAVAVETRDGNAEMSEPLHRLGVDTSNDQALAFCVFEGHRELPPLQASYEAIRDHGHGRYAVYQGRLMVSALKSGDRPRLRWLSPRDRMTEHLSRFSRRTWNVTEADSVLQTGVIEARPRSPRLAEGASIALFTHGLAPGGGERQWTYLALVMAELGYRPTMIVDNLRGENAHYLPLLEDAGVPVIDLSGMDDRSVLQMPETSWRRLSNLGSEVYERQKVMRLAGALARVKTEVLISQLDPPNLVAGFAGLVADTPRIIMSFRNYNPSHFSYLDAAGYRPMYRRLMRSPRVVFSGNDQGANLDYADWIGLAPERISWIPNAIDDRIFPPAPDGTAQTARAQLGVPASSHIVLGVFRLAHEKDPETFLAVADQVTRARPDVVFLHAGDGPLAAEMQRRARTLGIGDRLIFLGRRDDISTLMSLADVVLLTSRIEGMPNVVMEAQLSGRPVVATRAGGVEATLKDGETGLTAAVGDVGALTARCMALLDDPAHRAAMGAAGRLYAAAAFGRQAMAARYLTLAVSDTGQTPLLTPKERQSADVS